MPRVRRLSLVTSGIQKNGQPVGLDVFNQVVKHHNRESRAPITLGHPEKGADKIPALGRVDYPRVEGDALVVELCYTPELEALEDAGKFEGFSAGIYPRPDNGEFYLHHVAALGQLPPAADIKTQDLIHLADECEGVIILSCQGTPKETEAMDKTIEERFTKLEKMITEGLEGDKKTVTPPAPAPTGSGMKAGEEATTDPNTTALTQLQETMKEDRIAQITELADARGYSDEEKKPLLAMLKGAKAIELCSNAEGGLYQSVRGMISARPEVKAVPSTGASIFDALELSDDKGDKHTLDASQVAAFTKF